MIDHVTGTDETVAAAKQSLEKLLAAIEAGEMDATSSELAAIQAALVVLEALR